MRRPTLILALAAAAVAPATAAAKPGQLDKRYGTNGAFESRVLDGGFAARLDRRGGLLVAGGIYQAGIARLTARGRRDRAFAGRGIARAGRGGIAGIPFDVRRMRDGTIRTATLTVNSGGPVMAFLRYGARGERMPHVIHEPYMPGPMVYGAMARSGEAFVASTGGAYYEERSAEIRNIRPDGESEPGFGFGGTFRVEWIGGVGVGPLLERRGGVLFATRVRRRPALVQLLNDGRLDPTFGDGGIVRLPFDAGAVHVARGGDLVVAGSPRRYLARVVKFSAQGVRRRAFGVRGVAGWHRTNYGGPVDVASDRRGRIYVLANDFRGDRANASVLAFTRGGRRLARFGKRGRARLPKSRRRYSAHESADLVVDRGGLLVVGSYHIDGLYHAAFGGGEREDISAYETRLKVWRLDR